MNVGCFLPPLLCLSAKRWEENFVSVKERCFSRVKLSPVAKFDEVTETNVASQSKWTKMLHIRPYSPTTEHYTHIPL